MYSLPVNRKVMSGLAVLKCPHYAKGHYSNESERVAEVPSPEDVGRREHYVALCPEIAGDLLSACKTAEEKNRCQKKHLRSFLVAFYSKLEYLEME